MGYAGREGQRLPRETPVTTCPWAFTSTEEQEESNRTEKSSMAARQQYQSLLFVILLLTVGFFLGDPCTGRHICGDPDIAANDRALADSNAA